MSDTVWYPTLVAASDIARMTGLGQSAISNWRKRQETFPLPAESGPTGDLFRLSDVVEWLDATGRSYQLPKTIEEQLWAYFESSRGRDETDAATLRLLQVYAIRAYCLRNDPDLWPRINPIQHPKSLATFDDILETVDQAAGTNGGFARQNRFRELPPETAAHLYGLADQQDLATLLRTAVYAIDRTVAAPRFNRFITTHALASVLEAVLEPISGALHDPAAGYARLLAAAANDSVTEIVAQDINQDAARAGSLLLAIAGRPYSYVVGDAILNDAFPGQSFERIMIDPPMGLRMGDNTNLADDMRWEYGTPPKASMDTAWLQHAAAHLSKNGRAAVVVSARTLWSHGAEGAIRRGLIEADLVDAVVQLSPGHLGDSQVQAAIVVLDKQRQNRSSTILFVDATALGEHHRRGPTTIDGDDISLLEDTFASWRSTALVDAPRFNSTVATSEVLANDGRLTPSDYINYLDPRPGIDGVPFARLVADALPTVVAAVADIEATSLASIQAVESLQQADPLDDTWQEADIGDLVIANGITIGRHERRRNQKRGTEPTVLRPVVTTAFLADNPMIMAEIPSETQETSHRAVTTRDGDVLLSSTFRTANDQQLVSPVSTVRFMAEAAVHSNVIRIRVDETRILPEYLSLVLGSRLGSDALLAAASGTTIVRLKAASLARVRIPLPDLATQERLIDIADPVASLVSEIDTAHDAARRLSLLVVEGLVNGALYGE